MPIKRSWVAVIAVVAVVGGGAAYLWWPVPYCREAKRSYGLELDQCPDGTLRQHLRIRGSGLRRTGPGTVHISATALYTVSTADEWLNAPIEDFTTSLSLVSRSGAETPIAPSQPWKTADADQYASIVLPEVADGDYRLRARVTSKIGTTDVELPLALYAPARVHVLTDRPLYEPGNVVRFRALVLRANDLSPIDHREGMWVVTDPTGEELLQELAPAKEWGVVAGSFPLDSAAEPGLWAVTWRSGDARTSASFRVEPFTLPRFRVEAAADEPFYQPGDVPRLSGVVTYSSGAPVADSQIEIGWTVDGGAWPPPTSWSEGALPQRATGGVNGRFELQLPEVPADLQGQAHLVARIAAVDPAGDRVQGSATVLLSQHAISVQAITELSDGLVEGFNNRVYLRVTSADGRALPGANITVKRAWSATDPGIEALVDEDSVARVQLDPGPPVNVVVPAPPLRQRPAIRVVRRTNARDVVSQQPASLADQIAMDTWNAAVAGCAKWAGDGTASAQLVLRVAPSGAIVATDAGASPLDACVLAAVRRRRLAAGQDRLLSVTYQVDGSALPTLAPQIVEPLSKGLAVREAFARASLDARDCLPREFDGRVPWALQWNVRAGSGAVDVAWIRHSDGVVEMPRAIAACILPRFARHQLASPAKLDSMGLVRLTIGSPGGNDRRRPQPTIMQGYELLVSATVDGESFGSTKLRLSPGSIPPLRIRATPVVAKAGEQVDVELIRGPSFSGDVPEDIAIDHLGNRETAKVDPKTRTARYALPEHADGWYKISAGGALSLVYVRSGSELAVAVESDKPTYAPGQSATLAIRTSVAGVGAKAAVGLFGVDQSLAQLAPLTGPDDLRSVRPDVPMSAPAFGVLEAQALALGRIRGDNAAEATILRVTSVPTPSELDVQLSGDAMSQFDPIAELTDRFYPVLSELHNQTRAWEQTAPGSEQMTPATMATLWNKALDAVVARGQRVDDAFGRRLRLHRLPGDLLELTAPRAVVVVGTRLPEDVENWSEWIARRQP